MPRVISVSPHSYRNFRFAEVSKALDGTCGQHRELSILFQAAKSNGLQGITLPYPIQITEMALATTIFVIHTYTLAAPAFSNWTL
jgi:hypothetical protein